MSNTFGNPSVGTFIQEDATVNPYRLVKHGTDDQEVVAAAGTNALIVGVADETADATAGNAVGVVVQGVAKLCIASASTKGGAITGTTGGKGLVTTTQNQYCVGWLLETTTASNQVAKVLVSPFLYPTVS